MKENPLTALDSVEASRILQRFNEWIVNNPAQESGGDQLRKIIAERKEEMQNAPLKVLEYPAEALETRASEVLVFDESIAKIVEDMKNTMLVYRGVGLAANQVGILQRVIVVAIDGDLDNVREFINPEIVEKEGKITWQEGCLSFPALYEFIDRAKKVKVKARDATGQEFEFECEGLTAVCLQHEIDHLDGETFLDRMTRMKKQMALKRLKKQTKKR